MLPFIFFTSWKYQKDGSKGKPTSKLQNIGYGSISVWFWHIGCKFLSILDIRYTFYNKNTKAYKVYGYKLFTARLGNI
jgi:hypothetical protein